MSRTRQINLRLSEELYAELAEKAGSVPVSTFALRMLERALQGDLLTAPSQPQEPRVELRRPQQVRIDPGPILEPMADIYALLEEVLRAVHEHGAYLQMSRARATTHEATVMDARDAAKRAVMRFRQRNGKDQS